VAEQGNNVSDVGDNGIRVSSQERQKETQRTGVTPPAYTCASHGKSKAAPTIVLFFFFFLGILVTEKVVVQTI
jgi:hypothetical protein